MPAILGDEIIRVGFMGEAEKFHVGYIARETGRNVRLARVEHGFCRQVHDEAENLVVRPTVNLADIGQEKHGQQFLQSSLGENELKLSIEISVHYARRRGARAKGRANEDVRIEDGGEHVTV